MSLFKNVINTSNYLPQFQHSYQSSLCTTPCLFPSKVFLSSLENASTAQAQKLFEHEYKDILSNSAVFYTDGSKTHKGNHIGSACYSSQPHVKLLYKLSSYTSVFSAEAWTIHNVILLTFDMSLPRVTIISDSKNVLEALSNPQPKINNYLIPLIKAKLEAAQQRGTQIRLLWMPSHRGIRGNEIADSLAKRAIREGISPNFKVPFTNLFSYAKDKLDSRFDQFL